MALLLTVTCGLGWTLAAQETAGTAAERSALTLVRECKQYQLDAAGVAVAENSIAYDFTSHSDPAADLQSFARSTRAARLDGPALDHLVVGATEQTELAQAGTALDAYVELSDQINADFSLRTSDSLGAANAGVAALAYDTITGPLGQLERASTLQSDADLAGSASRGARDGVLVRVLLVAALALAGGIGVVVTRSITVRLRRTVYVLGQVAAGDLARRIEVDSADELGQMGTALNVALDRVEDRARAQNFESRLANALDMADGEGEVLAVVENSLRLTLPDWPSELLLADNSHAHLQRVVVASPTGAAPGCTVDSPDHCPAARRAQLQHFEDSDDLDACPKLRGRPHGQVQAVCEPVSILGRTVGVIHATQEPGVPFLPRQLSDLETLAKLAGARIGLLRVISETQLQAATDSLTGLMNRRSFEDKVPRPGGRAMGLSVAMADLDHFKMLNDTYGHETGDRSLRLFSQTLAEAVRGQDLVCRHGGEEFVIALPGCPAEQARRILDAVRARLDAAVTVAGLPAFTASFGIVDAGGHEDLPAVIARADAALFQAKREGRNRVVVHDGVGRVVPADPNPAIQRGLAGHGGFDEELEAVLPARSAGAPLT